VFFASPAFNLCPANTKGNKNNSIRDALTLNVKTLKGRRNKRKRYAGGENRFPHESKKWSHYGTGSLQKKNEARDICTFKHHSSDDKQATFLAMFAMWYRTSVLISDSPMPCSLGIV
jgi:hypothetical protein